AIMAAGLREPSGPANAEARPGLWWRAIALYSAAFLPFRAPRGLSMNSAAIDVVGIGNAIVDVIAPADDSFLAAQGFAKGAMTLIDAERAESLYAAMGPAIESSGGSAGNTMAGIASLGGAGAYIGKVRDDLLGNVFRHDITAI